MSAVLDRTPRSPPQGPLGGLKQESVHQIDTNGVIENKYIEEDENEIIVTGTEVATKAKTERPETRGRSKVKAEEEDADE